MVSDEPQAAAVPLAGATGAAPVALAGRVAAAVVGGALSWAAVGRAAGCSPTWARVLAGRAGLVLAGAGARRDVRLSIRVRGSGAARLDAEAAAEGVTRSEMGRRLIAEALTARDRAGRLGGP